ncbi:MAG: hypothetical protein GY944_11785 [bacterium]|nr:hypothetical protein [bacterium]
MAVSQLVLLVACSSGDTAIDLSFALNGLLIGTLMHMHVHDRRPDLFHSVTCTFLYTFFWLAPLLQVHAGELPNTLSVLRVDVIAANAVVLVFIAVYALTRRLLGDRSDLRAGAVGATIARPWWPRSGVVLLITVAVGLLAVRFGGYLVAAIVYRDLDLGVASHAELLIRKCLFSLPLLLALWAIMDPRLRRAGSLRWLAIAVAVGVLLLFKNPFNEKRNAIGPMYLIVFFAMFPGLLRSNLRVLGMFLLVIAVAFPFASALTHTKRGLEDSGDMLSVGLQGLDLRGGLVSLEFDAWAELVAAMHYTDDRGYALGEQALAALFFFVPRAWYPDKPEGSGKVVADYLMEEHQMWFDNLSSPLPAEGFLDFGWVGVVLYALVLALIGGGCRRWQGYHDLRWIVAAYTSLHLVYLLRGDLASSFAYLIAVLFAIVVLPLGLQVAIDWLLPGRVEVVGPVRR